MLSIRTPSHDRGTTAHSAHPAIYSPPRTPVNKTSFNPASVYSTPTKFLSPGTVRETTPTNYPPSSINEQHSLRNSESRDVNSQCRPLHSQSQSPNLQRSSAIPNCMSAQPTILNVMSPLSNTHPATPNVMNPLTNIHPAIPNVMNPWSSLIPQFPASWSLRPLLSIQWSISMWVYFLHIAAAYWAFIPSSPSIVYKITEMH